MADRTISGDPSPEELLREALDRALRFDPVAAYRMSQEELRQLAARLAAFVEATENPESPAP